SPLQYVASVNNMGAGIYSVTVTDANNCTVTRTLTLSEPAKLVLTIDSLSNYNGYNIRCNGSADGEIYTSVSGGVPAYNYQWNNGGNNQVLTNVGSGTYTLIVTDLNNCAVQTEASLSEPTPITFTSIVKE